VKKGQQFLIDKGIAKTANRQIKPAGHIKKTESATTPLQRKHARKNQGWLVQTLLAY